MAAASNPQSTIHNSESVAATAIIPARYDSVRFPGKILADRTGKPLIQHVFERAARAKRVDRVIVATDDARIQRAVEAFGGEAIMTRRDHPNGTSRIAEVAQNLDAPIIVNVQGDEPEIEPELIDRTIQSLMDHTDCLMATLASPFIIGEDPANPNIVKVVVDQAGCAMYFSRALIPHARDIQTGAPLKHVGLYVYRRDFLLKYVALPPTPLEQIEKLEQLRVIEHGFKIAVALGEARFHGIDTPEQYDRFVTRHAQFI
jgi:3-deoxy-manno-octulosonate cytidylyltransferase (CMP-KDO synthetase)